MEMTMYRPVVVVAWPTRNCSIYSPQQTTETNTHVDTVPSVNEVNNDTIVDIEVVLM